MYKEFKAHLKESIESDKRKNAEFQTFSKEKKLFLYGNLSIFAGLSNLLIFTVIFPLWFTFFSDLGLGVHGKPLYLIAGIACCAIIAIGFYLRHKYKNCEENM